ncbi:hypothetical protein HY213_03915 [Candidatus Peregrinibacteria bacterium]|nr:hypothetical protein [Candidatus Peregrinibacteria bacterium]
MPRPRTLPEVLTTSIGGIVLGLYAGVLSPLQIAASTSTFARIGLSFFARSSVIGTMTALSMIALFSGLVYGFRRHSDLTSLLFAAIGSFMLAAGDFLIPSGILCVLGGFLVLAGSAASVLSPARELRPPAQAPTLDVLFDHPSQEPTQP